MCERDFSGRIQAVCRQELLDLDGEGNGGTLGEGNQGALRKVEELRAMAVGRGRR